MSALVDTATCPSWCGGDHTAYRNCHPNDASVTHLSQVLEEWTAEGASDPITVRVNGTRFDTRDAVRWPDTIDVTGETCPGFEGGGLELGVADARRLAEAILAACVLIESSER